MQNRVANNRIWIWLALLLALILCSWYLLAQKQLKEYPPYTSDSPSQTGTKAFYTYLENHQDGVSRWFDSPNLLPIDSEEKILVMVEPYFIPNRKDMESYKRFMEDGNTILLFQGNPKGMFNLETDFVEVDALPVFDQERARYHVEVPSPFRVRTNAQDEVLLSDDAGVIALKRQFGEGQLIVTNSPGWLMNSKIVFEDHLALILALLHESDAKVLLVDEYIHGEKNAATVFTVYPRWFLLFIGQGAILTIFWLWYRGKRFGPVFIAREETVRFSDEGIQALAAWYIRGRRYHDSLAIQEDYVKTLLQEHWRIPYPQEWRDLTDHFERKRPHMPKAEIDSLLTGLSSMLNKGKLSKQEYVYWSKELDKVRKEVEVG